MAHIVRATSTPPGAESRGDEVTVRVERRSHDAARGHAVVATFGQRALAGADFSLLLAQTVSLVADTLKLAAAAVCEVTERGKLLLRAGHGLTTATAGDSWMDADPLRFPASALDCEIPLGESPGLDRDSRLEQEGFTNAVGRRLHRGRVQSQLPAKVAIHHGALKGRAEHIAGRMRATRFEIAGFLQKPFTPATLVQTMQDAVRLRAQEHV